MSITTGYILDEYDIVTVGLEMSEAKESKWSYVLAILAPVFGGAVAYVMLRNHDTKMARNCLFISIAYVVLFSIMGIEIYTPAPSTESSISAELAHRDKIISFVQNYRGTNGTGLSVSEVIVLAINLSYPEENILANPSTTHDWSAFIPADQPSNVNTWEVDFDFSTYKENTKIRWYVNMDTRTIYPEDQHAKNILDIVNTPSSSVNNNTLANFHLI